MMRLSRIYVTSLSLALFLIAGPAKESSSETPALWREGGKDYVDSELERLDKAFAGLAEKVRPAVVQIRAVRKASNDAKKDFPTFENIRGSGFIINPEGYILTAYHVIDAASEIEILLTNRQRLSAEVVAGEPQVDVALLKVNGHDLPVLALGDSGSLRVGELVASASYPFGREGSVSLGIVGRKGKNEDALGGFDFIQTDAVANAGSSGGPLVNVRAEVVGMVTMASESGTLGFAVPINVIKHILPRLVNGEKIVWGWLGVRVAELTLRLADSLGLSPARGVLVSSVLPDQAAAKGNILPQDVILAINGIEVDSPRELTRLVRGAEAGTKVSLTIFRKGQILHRPVILEPRPKEGADRPE